MSRALSQLEDASAFIYDDDADDGENMSIDYVPSNVRI